MDLEGYRSAAQAHWRKEPPEDQYRAPMDSALYDAIELVADRTLPHLLAAYGVSDLNRIPGGRTNLASIVRCQLTAWLLGRHCETWLGLDRASVNTVCWFVTQAPVDVLAAAVLLAHKTQPIPDRHKDDIVRLAVNAPSNPFTSQT